MIVRVIAICVYFFIRTVEDAGPRKIYIILKQQKETPRAVAASDKTLTLKDIKRESVTASTDSYI